MTHWTASYSETVLYFASGNKWRLIPRRRIPLAYEDETLKRRKEQEEDQEKRFDMLFNGDNNGSKENDSLDKSDNIEESPQHSTTSTKEKDSKKTKLLGKIFVSTPERKVREEVQSEVIISLSYNN